MFFGAKLFKKMCLKLNYSNFSSLFTKVIAHLNLRGFFLKFYFLQPIRLKINMISNSYWLNQNLKHPPEFGIAMSYFLDSFLRLSKCLLKKIPN